MRTVTARALHLLVLIFRSRRFRNVLGSIAPRHAWVTLFLFGLLFPPQNTRMFASVPASQDLHEGSKFPRRARVDTSGGRVPWLAVPAVQLAPHLYLTTLHGVAGSDRAYATDESGCTWTVAWVLNASIDHDLVLLSTKKIDSQTAKAQVAGTVTEPVLGDWAKILLEPETGEAPRAVVHSKEVTPKALHVRMLFAGRRGQSGIGVVRESDSKLFGVIVSGSASASPAYTIVGVVDKAFVESIHEPFEYAQLFQTDRMREWSAAHWHVSEALTRVENKDIDGAITEYIRAFDVDRNQYEPMIVAIRLAQSAQHNAQIVRALWGDGKDSVPESAALARARAEYLARQRRYPEAFQKLEPFSKGPDADLSTALRLNIIRHWAGLSWHHYDEIKALSEANLDCLECHRLLVALARSRQCDDDALEAANRFFYAGPYGAEAESAFAFIPSSTAGWRESVMRAYSVLWPIDKDAASRLLTRSLGSADR